MFEFEERNPSEKVFAAIWNTDIAPCLPLMPKNTHPACGWRCGAPSA
jgi:hypothetical protein